VRTNIILQPFADDDALVEVLRAALANEAYGLFSVTVAWARPSGLRHLVDGMDAFSRRGGLSEIIVGIDEGGASVQGLEMALEMFDSARVLYDATGGTFHPKIYVFRGQHEALLIVGSNNLTAGGLYYNYEAAQVVTLDLGLAPDVVTLAALDDYLNRLREDNTCRDLSSELIEALAVDPHFRVSLERRTPRVRDDSLLDEPFAPITPLFGATKYKRKAFKATAATASASASASTGSLVPAATILAGTSSETGGSMASVVARWSKKLTRSDCGQPRPGSNTTGALRFTQARHPIKQATWFRQVLFSDNSWTADPTHVGRERASIRFDVEIQGAKLGTHVLALKHDAEREADQSNFTTDLKWGSLTPAIIAQDLVGSYVVVERLQDGTHRMRIESAEPEGFLDMLSVLDLKEVNPAIRG
jgi:hypothetical protein